MIDNVHGIVRPEIGQNRYNNSAIRHGGKIHNAPVGRISSHKSYLVSLPDPGFPEQNMYLKDLLSNLFVSIPFFSIVRQSLYFPVLSYTLFNITNQTFLNHRLLVFNVSTNLSQIIYCYSAND